MNQQARQQGAAPDRLQPCVPLVPRFTSGFRRRVSLIVGLQARSLEEIMKHFLRSTRYELPDGDVVCMEIELMPQELHDLDSASQKLETLASVMLGLRGGEPTTKPLTHDRLAAQQGAARRQPTAPFVPHSASGCG